MLRIGEMSVRCTEVANRFWTGHSCPIATYRIQLTRSPPVNSSKHPDFKRILLPETKAVQLPSTGHEPWYLVQLHLCYKSGNAVHRNVLRQPARRASDSSSSAAPFTGPSCADAHTTQDHRCQ